MEMIAARRSTDQVPAVFLTNETSEQILHYYLQMRGSVEWHRPAHAEASAMSPTHVGKLFELSAN
jgi:hypothetical protein